MKPIDFAFVTSPAVALKMTPPLSKVTVFQVEPNIEGAGRPRFQGTHTSPAIQKKGPVLLGLWLLLNELGELWREQRRAPQLALCFKDAFNFAGTMPPNIQRPLVWTDSESEVAFEWIDPVRHAIVSFEGNGFASYAMKCADKVTPGAKDTSVEIFPSDLKRFLNANDAN